MDKTYAKINRGEVEAKEPLRGTWDIVKNALGTICYQEHVMRIAQVVAGFDDNQADSYLRKALAKKDTKKMELCKQWFIYGKINSEMPASGDTRVHYDPKGEHGKPILGGVNNGYTEEELEAFWEDIKGYASYLFNASHAACYSFLSLCTMYLKTYHRAEFLAALLSLQSEQEKIALYCRVSQSYGITVTTPDINLSNANFTAVDNKILYGLKSIKGVGAAAIPALIENRPYKNLEDAHLTVGKKFFNKKIGEALIKAGAFDFQDENRNKMLNLFQDLRKAKKEDRFDEDLYNINKCNEYELNVLGSRISQPPYWDTVLPGEVVSVEFSVKSIREKIDKNGNVMAFIEAIIEDSIVKGVVFSSTYCNNIDLFDSRLNNVINAKIQKDDRGGFMIKRILKSKPRTQNTTSNKEVTVDMIDAFNRMIDGLS